VLFRLQAGAHPEVSATSMTPWAYGTTQLGVIAHYLRLSLWPQPLVVDYDDWPIARTVADVLPGAVVVVALLGVTLWAARRHPRWSFLGAWFFLILAPSSSVLPLAAEIAAERRMYVPLAAVVALAVVGGYEILGHVFRRFRHGEALRAAAGVCMVVIATGVLGLGTIRRNEDYRSLISIWGDTVAKRPNNSRAQNNLGTAYHMAGQLEEARKHYAEAVRVKPGFAVAQTNLAVVLVKQGKLAEAIAHFNQSLAARASLSVHANTRKQLAWALARHGRIEDAIADYREAVRLAPGDADALTSLADLLRRQGRLDEAVEAYSRALGIRPNQASTHVSLGQTLASQGKIADATRHFEAALRLDPNHPQARRALADLRNGVTRATP
jgi:Flp pilus assembly protein TadD